MIRAAAALLLFLAASARAETLYVSNEESNVVHIVDGATLKETGRIEVGKRPRGLGLSPDGKSLYVAVSDDNRIAVVDLASAKVTGHLPSGPDPETFAVAPDGKRLFIANENDNLLTIVDVARAAVASEIPVGGEPEGTAVSPDGRLVVQCSESGAMAHVVDTATGEVIDNLLVDTRPRFAAFAPDGRSFWVSSEARGTVSVFASATRKPIGRIDFAGLVPAATAEVFAQPIGIVFSHDGKRAFVALGRAKLVAEVDPSTLKIVRTFPVGWRAWNLALSADGKRLYTANGLTGDVSAIDLVANKPAGAVALGNRRGAMKRLLLALLLVASPVGARELRVCADPNNLPFSNERREGFENKLVDLVAKDLGATVSYTWWAQRRGNVRETLKDGKCDLIPGVGSSLEMLATTRPYYRSTYVAVTRRDRNLDISSFDDPRLEALRIGVSLIGDDFSNTPPAHALAKRGIVDNVRGFMVYGDYDKPAPQADIVEAVASGEVDIAFVWGPVAGYFAARSSVPLALTPVPPFDGPQLPMVFDVSMGTRKEDRALREEVEGALARHSAEVKALLAGYGVPLVENRP
jgi:mxaJ protein